MTGPLYRLGRLCARHRLVVLLLWLVAVFALAAVARSIGQETTDDLVLPGTDSQRATDTLTSRFPDQANGTNPIALEAPKGKSLGDKAYKDSIDAVVKTYKHDNRVIKVVSPLGKDGTGQLAKHKRIGYISLTLRDSASELSIDE